MCKTLLVIICFALSFSLTEKSAASEGQFALVNSSPLVFIQNLKFTFFISKGFSTTEFAHQGFYFKSKLMDSKIDISFPDFFKSVLSPLYRIPHTDFLLFPRLWPSLLCWCNVDFFHGEILSVGGMDLLKTT